MKVYVSELPKKCEDCYCLYYDDYAECYKCPLMLDNEVKYWAICRDKDCPLQSIADYTKQVRKEVCEEIKKLMQEKKGVMIGRYNYQTAQHDEVEVFELGDLNKVLNKIIGE